MAFCGKRDVQDLARDVLLVPEGFEGRWQGQN
jgi:L-lactate dehydrogenase (cytochrome)